MKTDCTPTLFEFEPIEKRRVEAAFDGGVMTSNAGDLLLWRLDQGMDLSKRVAACFSDRRDPARIEHALQSMIAQRVHGIALGMEDLIDHHQFRHDPVVQVLTGKTEAKRSDCAVGAGQHTLNRLENAPLEGVDRHHKITVDETRIEKLFLDLFLDAKGKTPKEFVIIDFDATDFPLHGRQEDRFFHGYYDTHCYLPLYAFCGGHLLAAKLRPSNIDGSAGTLEEIIRIVAHLRSRWPRVKILIRGDSGFARDAIMTWCEENKVDFLFGMARNERLQKILAPELAEAKRQSAESGKAARVFKDFRYRTLTSWTTSRRVVGKAEQTLLGSNPRFVVTSLAPEAHEAKPLYENLYCARGDMENRIKEQQLGLFADRMSAHAMRANQIRLWLASFAYVLIHQFRRVGLRWGRLANAQVETIQSKIFKVAAWVRISVRRIRFGMASSHPWQQEFALADALIRQRYPSPG